MRRRAALTIVLAFWVAPLFAQSPSVAAVWVGPGEAEVAWSGGELWKVGGGRETHIDRPSPVLLSFGGDSAYAPFEGDRFEVRSVETGAVVAAAVLGLAPSRVVLPLIVKAGTPPRFTVRLVLVVN